jgi:hypothetical protein
MDTMAFPRLALALALALAAPPGLAGEAASGAINLDTYETALLRASGHPNELNRWHGIWNYDNGRVDEARMFFERAALYGDKLSQHFLTVMYWQGDEGLERDPALAYVWADLAAERGDNRDLLGMRERIWRELTPEQRRHALEIGPAYYARYGDVAAKKRTNTELRRFLRNQTGSRVGGVTGPMDIGLGRPEPWGNGAPLRFGTIRTTGTEFYAANRTQPEAYWKSQDKNLRALLSRVQVGEVHKVRDDRRDSRP